MVHAALSQVVLIRTIGDIEWGIRDSYYTVTMRQGESTRVNSSSLCTLCFENSLVWNMILSSGSRWLPSRYGIWGFTEQDASNHLGEKTACIAWLYPFDSALTILLHRTKNPSSFTRPLGQTLLSQEGWRESRDSVLTRINISMQEHADVV